MPDDGIAKPAFLPSLSEDGSGLGAQETFNSHPQSTSGTTTENSAAADEHLSSRSSSYDSVDISPTGRLGMGAKFFRDVGIWGGQDAKKWKFSIKGPGLEEFSWDGDSLTVVGDLAVQNQFTAGHKVNAGRSVAINPTDGLIYQARIKNIGTLNTQVATTAFPFTTGQIEGNVRHFDISDTVKVGIFGHVLDDANSQWGVIRFAIDPTVPTAATVTNTNQAAAGIRNYDAINPETNKVIVIRSKQTATISFDAYMVSGLDTTITIGSAVQLLAASVTGIGCAEFSSSKFVVFYTKTADNTVYFQPPTWSGTTITAGSEAATALTGAVKSVIKFPTDGTGTEYYLVIHGTDCTVLSYDGATLTTGTTVAFDAGTIAVNGGTSFALVDTGTAVVGFNNGTNHVMRMVTRAGTVPTVNAATTLDAIVNAQDPTCIYQWGEFTFMIANLTSSTNYKVRLYDVDGSSLTQLGSTFDVSVDTTNGGALMPARFSPTKAMFWCNEDTGGSPNFQVDTMNLDSNYNRFIGVSAEAIAKNASGKVTVQGVNEVVSGLSNGNRYFTDTDENFSTADVSQGVTGVALSATKIVVK